MSTANQHKKEKVKCPECGWKMTRYNIAGYYDLEDNLKIVPFVRYCCRRCGLSSVDADGNRVHHPLPVGVVVGPGWGGEDDKVDKSNKQSWKRPYCAKCGMKVKSTPITDYVYDDGDIVHSNYLLGINCFLCGRSYSSAHEFPKNTDEVFLSHLRFPRKIKELWNIDYKKILNSTEKSSGEKIFKFCYSPKSHEILLGAKPEHHRSLIDAYGRCKFDNYVRGIYFEKKKLIYLRMHSKPIRLVETYFVLRRLGTPKSVRIVWGEDEARRLAEDLKRL